MTIPTLFGRKEERDVWLNRGYTCRCILVIVGVDIAASKRKICNSVSVRTPSRILESLGVACEDYLHMVNRRRYTHG